MTVKVLAIGDVGNMMSTLRKIVKRSDVHLINFPRDGAGIFTYPDNVELFDSYKVSKQVKKINKIKDGFDICITMGWSGARIAYLADLNYIIYFVGRDINVPPFIKNSNEEWFKEPLYTLNFLERRFYKNVLDGAIACVAGSDWLINHLKKYRKDGIRMDRFPVDKTLFNTDIKPVNKNKIKFTFFSPQRMGLSKGYDIIWKALTLCKSDFEVMQVEWFNELIPEEKRIKKQLLETKPNQVKFVPMLKREELAKYYMFADAVLGHMRYGTHALIECEATLCKRPVVHYSNPEMKTILDGKQITPPFLPHSNDPKDVAEIIDKVVESKDFREKLAEEEYKFVKDLTDPEKVAEWWDNLFEDLVKKHKSIKKNSSSIRVKFRVIYFLVSNRLYFKKIRNKLNAYLYVDRRY